MIDQAAVDVLHWMLFFYIYCFLGWIIESTYVSVKTGIYVNRGFMKGPVIPIYGTGAVIILACTIPFKSSIIAVFVFGTISASILEYLTGFFMEKFFKVKYWDYSDCKYNLHGYICLFNSLCWGLLAIIMIYGVHHLVETGVDKIHPLALLSIVSGISSVFVIDAWCSSETAMELKKMLTNSEKLKDDLTLVHNKLGELQVAIENSKEIAEDFRNKSPREMLNSVTTNILDACPDDVPAEIMSRFEAAKERYEQFKFLESKNVSKVFRNNPTLKSKAFSNSTDNMKEIYGLNKTQK